MWLIRTALRRPITILIVIVGVALMSVLAIQRMKVDIFPDLGTPVIYVAQPYGGMDPAQMEGFVANYSICGAGPKRCRRVGRRAARRTQR
jgi:multidrug efflux pump subunit AcrB